MKNKDLLLLSSKESYNNKDGKLVEFTKLYVLINGIECQLQASDRTAKLIIEKYLEGGFE